MSAAAVSATVAVEIFADAVRTALAPYHTGSARAVDLARLRDVAASVARVRAEAEDDTLRLDDKAAALTAALNRAGPPKPESFMAYQIEAAGVAQADSRRGMASDLRILEQGLAELIATHERTQP